MSRGYGQRCIDRLARLRRRAEFLADRIALRVDNQNTHDKQERSALLWAIEEIDRWDIVVAALGSELSDTEKLATIESLIRSRLQPSVADRQRTVGLRGSAARCRGGGNSFR